MLRRALPPVEITFTLQGTNVFLTYEARWQVDHADYSSSDIGLPKGRGLRLTRRMQRLCERVFATLEYRDCMRVDLRVRGSELFVLEAHCNPGVGDDNESAISIAHKAVGISFDEFVWMIVISCMERFGKPVKESACDARNPPQITTAIPAQLL